MSLKEVVAWLYLGVDRGVYGCSNVSAGPKGGLGGTCPPEETMSAIKKKHFSRIR